MSELIKSLQSCIPCEFVRKPRGLDEVDRFKAVECRLFFYYLAPAVFNVFWPEDYVMHFNSLHAALTILSNEKQHKENNSCAKDLIKWYIDTFKILYGEDNLVFTFHCLLHLPEQALLHGILDNVTAYPFENYMRTLLKMIRRPKDPLPQLFRGFVVRSQFLNSLYPETSAIQKFPQFVHPYEVDLPFNCSTAFRGIHFRDFKLLEKYPDNCCYMNDGSIIFIEHITIKDGKPAIIGKTFSGLKCFPNYPGNSQELGLYVSAGFSDINIFPVNEISKKAVVLTLNDQYYIIPLLHSTTCDK